MYQGKHFWGTVTGGGEKKEIVRGGKGDVQVYNDSVVTVKEESTHLERGAKNYEGRDRRKGSSSEKCLPPQEPEIKTKRERNLNGGGTI